MKVGVERDRDGAVGAAPGEDVRVVGCGKADLRHVRRLDPGIPEEGRGAARDALVEKQLHYAVFVSTISSPSIAAA